MVRVIYYRDICAWTTQHRGIHWYVLAAETTPQTYHSKATDTQTLAASPHVCHIQQHMLLIMHTINGLFSRITWVSRHQKGNHYGFCWNKRWWGGSGISWTKSNLHFAPCCRQITIPVTHHSVFACQMSFLPRNQQRQSTVGIRHTTTNTINNDIIYFLH